jgi:Trk-type K+ transport system membrane component
VLPRTGYWQPVSLPFSLHRSRLSIPTSVIDAIPVGKRVAAAFLQSAAVRAAGFGIVPLNALAPAVK